MPPLDSELCGYNAGWDKPCKTPRPCPEHGKKVCWKCEAPAVAGCSFAGQFVCGIPYCSEHPHMETHYDNA